MDSWVEQVIALLDALEIEKTHVVGNSFGGSLALWLAWKHPERVDRLVLMGPGGWPAVVNANLELLWNFEPTADHMRKAMSAMAWNQSLITDELVAMRLKACQRPGALDHFHRLFPPRASAGWTPSACRSVPFSRSNMKCSSSMDAMTGWSIRRSRGTCTSTCAIRSCI